MLRMVWRVVFLRGFVGGVPMGECELCRMGVYGNAVVLVIVIVVVVVVNGDTIVDVGVTRVLLAVLKDRRDRVRVAGRKAMMCLSYRRIANMGYTCLYRQ